MNARNVIEMIKHYFQLGDDGLDFDREARARGDRRLRREGRPRSTSPAQVEQQALSTTTCSRWSKRWRKTHHATALAGSADEKGMAPPLEDGMIAPTKGASATVTFEEHSWRH